MPSTSATARLFERATTQRNLTIAAAVLLALPGAYAFRATVGGGDAGSFLLLVTLAVGVPTAYEEYWPRYDRSRTAVAWVLGACAVATAEFTGLYLLGTDALGLAPTTASVGAFLLTDLGNLAWLAVRTRG
ncbi:MAG: hypothetical protein ABEJ61_00685 [Haloferacaceae archaeon]